jgi:hypothetical protein
MEDSNSINAILDLASDVITILSGIGGFAFFVYKKNPKNFNLKKKKSKILTSCKKKKPFDVSNCHILKKSNNFSNREFLKKPMKWDISHLKNSFGVI